jgi:hypothetical protein
MNAVFPPEYRPAPTSPAMCPVMELASLCSKRQEAVENAARRSICGACAGQTNVLTILRAPWDRGPAFQGRSSVARAPLHEENEI